MGVTLTQRVGEFLHVLVQVLVQAVQLSHIPAGHCFKQHIDVECLAVSLAILASKPSIHNEK